MSILTVGRSGTYNTIAAAVAAAHDGDTVQVEAGTYVNDFVHVTSAITIQSVGGVAHLVATVAPPDGKAIMTTDATATIRGLDFSGAKVADANGAGIRYEGGSLTLIDCSFHNNENGLLSAVIPDGVLTITDCTFSDNGNGNGLTHNLYVGDIARLVVTGSTFTGVNTGHEIKSRAETTIIQNNTIIDGATSTASYSIDLPNGGNALIANNVIEKGANAENQTVIHYGGEAIPYAGSQLTITGNTVTNDLTAHQTVLLTNATSLTATISGNRFLGVPIATYAAGPATLSGNTTATGALPDSSSTALASGENAMLFTDAADHTVVLPHAGMALGGGAGRLTATGWSHETVMGGAGGIVWNGQDGADQIVTVANSRNTVHLGAAGNVVQSSGTDAITLGNGNNSIAIAGTATLSGGTGNNTISVAGTATVNGAGVDRISVGPNGTLTAVESNVTYINSNGGTFSLAHTAGRVADTITVSGGAANLVAGATGLAVTMAGGGHGAQITLGTGTAQVQSAGPDTIKAGAGAATVILSGSAEVYAGTGALTVFGRGISGLATVHGGAAPVTIDGDSGNIRFQAEGTGPSVVNDRLSRTTIVGGAGLLTVNAFAGNASVAGGSGGIVLNAGAGGLQVSTAAGSSNVLNLVGGSTVTGAGRDAVNLLTNENSSVTESGAATVLGGTGNNTYLLNGNATLFARSAGVDRTTVGGAAHVRMASSAAMDQVQVQGGKLDYAAGSFTGSSLASAGGTIAAISGWAQVERTGGAPVTVSTAGGHATAVALQSAARVVSQGTDTISAGAGFLTASTTGSSQVRFGAGGGSLDSLGDATVTGGAGAVRVSSSNGALRFTGDTGAATVETGAGSATVVAGAGNLTLRGGAGALQVTGGAGSAVIGAGTGTNTISLGAGAMTVNAGAGNEVLTVTAGQAHGALLVNNWDAGHDSLVLSGYSPGAAHASAFAGGTLVTLNDGTSLQFAGVSRLPGFA